MSRTGRACLAYKARGITLIELMVVIVVVGILAAIAYPSYQRQVQQTRRADGKAALLQAAQELERCFTRFNAYNNGNCAAHLDINAKTRLSPEGWYSIEYVGAPGATSFTLQAAPMGAQADDNVCGVLTLTHTGLRGAGGPVDVCW